MKWKFSNLIPKSLKGSLLLVFTLLSVAAAPPGYLTLNADLKVRSNASNFYKNYDGNFLFTVPPGTVAKILKTKTDLGSGNLAYQVQIVKTKDGQKLNQTVWIYDDVKNHPERLTLCYDIECNNTTLERSKTQVAVRTETVTPTFSNAPKAKPVISAQQSELAASVLTCENGNCLTPNPSDTQALTNKFQEVYEINPAMGARKVMATLYQSCEVLEKPPYDWSFKVPPHVFSSFRSSVNNTVHPQAGIQRQFLPEAIANNYYLRDINPGPNCRDMRQTPPGYFYGGKAEMNGKTINLFATNQTQGQSGLAPSYGLDCSGFISASLAAVGRRMTPQGGRFMTSGDFINAGKGQDCFDRPRFTKNSTIEPGDVLSFGTHVVMVDKVTNPEDPFGLAKRGSPLRVEDCYKAQDPKSLNFTLIQSTGTGQRNNSNIGVARTSAASYMKSRMGAISRLATAACLAKATGTPQALPSSQAWSLVRHSGSSRAACMDPAPMKMTGFQCVESCFAEHVRGGI